MSSAVITNTAAAVSASRSGRPETIDTSRLAKSSMLIRLSVSSVSAAAGPFPAASAQNKAQQPDSANRLIGSKLGNGGKEPKDRRQASNTSRNRKRNRWPGRGDFFMAFHRKQIENREPRYAIFQNHGQIAPRAAGIGLSRWPSKIPGIARNEK
ncbi:MAG: hypothetical protein V9H25_19365 [Candidatus Competibacter sp.]